MSSAGTNGTNGTDVGTTLTTQGDLLYRNASGLARLGYGTSGNVLTTKGSGQNPVWEPASGGLVLATYQLIDYTDRTTTSTTPSQAGSIQIQVTPASVDSKFHITWTGQLGTNQGSRRASLYVYRDGSNISPGGGSAMSQEIASGGYSTELPASVSFIDDPDSTAQMTYQIYFANNVNGGDTAYVRRTVFTIIEYAS